MPTDTILQWGVQALVAGIVGGLLTGVVAAVTFKAVMTVELRYIKDALAKLHEDIGVNRRDIDKAHERLDRHIELRHANGGNHG